ncbi:putative reductase, partial [Caligus rogercresseyi]
MSPALSEFTILSNGLRLPCVGLGTYRIRDPDTLRHAIQTAIASGYRLLDTASVYRNSGVIGQVLEGIPEEVFLTSKLGPKEMGAERARSAVSSMLRELKRDSLDCLLIHWPGAQGLSPSDPVNGDLRLQTWR